jgi:hypothetical protein
MEAGCWTWDEWYELVKKKPQLRGVEITHIGGSGPGRDGCTSSVCNGVYTCERCRKLFGWCYGASDDLPDYCDDCWAACSKEKAS